MHYVCLLLYAVEAFVLQVCQKYIGILWCHFAPYSSTHTLNIKVTIGREIAMC